MTPNIIWVAGHSGVRKSFLCQTLKSLLNCDVIATGEIIRSFYPNKSEISDSEIFRIIHDCLAKRKTNLVLIDDFPFNKNQFMAWWELYPSPLCVFYLEDGQCGKERKLKRKRQDDSEIEYMVRKLRYEEEVDPIIRHLENQNLVYRLYTSAPFKTTVEVAYMIIRNQFMNSSTSFCDITKLVVQKHHESAKLPVKKYPFSAGYDVYLTDSCLIKAHETTVCNISLSVEIAGRTSGIIFARSSVAARGVLTHNGVIDPAYSEELKIVLSNLTNKDIFLGSVDPVAQLLILPTYCPEIIEAATVNVGRSGFGSSNQHGNIHE